MTERDNGGLITPRRRYVKDGDGMSEEMQGGMTLRDMFAGQALPFCLEEFLGVHPDSQRACAECAYGIADAMLAERQKP